MSRGSMEHIRRTRRVPAKRGMRVTVDGREGLIKSASHGYINVQFVGGGSPVPCHPTWKVVYYDADGSVLWDAEARPG